MLQAIRQFHRGPARILIALLACAWLSAMMPAPAHAAVASAPAGTELAPIHGDHAAANHRDSDALACPHCQTADAGCMQAEDCASAPVAIGVSRDDQPVDLPPLDEMPVIELPDGIDMPLRTVTASPPSPPIYLLNDCFRE